MSDKSGFTGLGVIMAFAGGALAGTVAALLLAPKSGADTREDLRKIASDGAHKIGRLPGAIKEAYSEGAEDLREIFAAAPSNGEPAIAKIKS